MSKTIAIIKGDGISPEIVSEAMGVLDTVAAKFGHTFTYVDAPMGGCAIDAFGVPLPDSSLETCLKADSVLLGAVGGPKSVSYTHLDVYKRQPFDEVWPQNEPKNLYGCGRTEAFCRDVSRESGRTLESLRHHLLLPALPMEARLFEITMKILA